MKNKEIFNHYYKYRKFKNRESFYKYDNNGNIIGFDDCGLDALSKGKVWFSHLDYLNDPYENQGDYDTSSLYHKLDDYLLTMPANIPLNVKEFLLYLKRRGDSDEEIIKRIEMGFPDEEKLQNEIPRRLQEIETIKQVTGILSLSELKDSLLMWSYYADDHYGYCLEFSSTEQHCSYKNGMSYNKCFSKVVYDSKYYTFADINPFFWFESEAYSEDRMLELKKRIFCHKSKEWDHEKEWRIFLDITAFKKDDNASGALLPFPGKLTTIYCGARMSDDAIDALKQAVSVGNYGYKPKFKKAKLKKGEFGLEFDDC